MTPTPSVTGQERLLVVLQKALGHELPNRLVALQGLARVLALEEGERLSADGRDYLARIAAGADGAHALVSALAEATRLAAQGLPGGKADLAEVAEEAVAEAKQLAPEQPAAYHGPGHGLILNAPDTALRKALVLLLRRAASGTPPDQAGRVEVTASAGGGAAEIRIVCTGLDLSPAMIDRLFEPFSRAGDAGLDLFLVRQLAEGWGGAVRVESAPGGGTAFVLTCPVKSVIEPRASRER